VRHRAVRARCRVDSCVSRAVVRVIVPFAGVARRMRDNKLFSLINTHVNNANSSGHVF
jgi:hypothetical protein